MTLEDIGCARYGCTDVSLTDEQRQEAHEQHIASLEPPPVPKLAFCDSTSRDKAHHISPYCAVMEGFRGDGSLYIPKTNARVIRGLYPKPCSECCTPQ
jgi:hypothetical protein